MASMLTRSDGNDSDLPAVVEAAPRAHVQHLRHAACRHTCGFGDDHSWHRGLALNRPANKLAQVVVGTARTDVTGPGNEVAWPGLRPHGHGITRISLAGNRLDQL